MKLVTFKCDGCQKVETGDEQDKGPAGWWEISSPNNTEHACSQDCMLRLVRLIGRPYFTVHRLVK
jgi:hypothetical protein